MPYAAIHPHTEALVYMNSGFRGLLHELNDPDGRHLLHDDPATLQALRDCLSQRATVSVINPIIGRAVIPLSTLTASATAMAGGMLTNRWMWSG